MSNGTSSEVSPTETTSAPGAPGDFFVESVTYDNHSFVQKMCKYEGLVTQQIRIDTEIFNQEGRALSMRILLCTDCGTTQKHVHSHPASIGKPLPEPLS